MTTARILAFAGSSRKESWNRKVLEVAVAGAREAQAEVTVVNLADYPMPIYNADWHAENGVPPAMLELRALMMAVERPADRQPRVQHVDHAAAEEHHRLAVAGRRRRRRRRPVHGQGGRA